MFDVAATVSLEYIEFKVNRKYYKYSTIQFGDLILDTTQFKRTLLGDMETIIIDSSRFANILTNPNFFGDTIGIDSLYSPYNSIGIAKGYRFLKPKHRIGLTLNNFQFIACRDSNAKAELQSCGMEQYSVSVIAIRYKNSCLIDSSKSIIIDNDRRQLNHLFEGVAISSAIPLDVGTVAASTHIEASFDISNRRPDKLQPWQLSFPYDTLSLLDYSKQKIQAVLFLPNSLYSLDTVFYYSSLDTSKQFTLAKNITGTNQWVFNFDSIHDPEIRFDFNLGVICAPNSSGYADFKIEYRSILDTVCDDCYITYGCSDFRLLRHCIDSCASYVQTHNFKFERRSFGWNNYLDYITNSSAPRKQLPTGSSLTNLYKYYPYDLFELRSDSGEIFKDSTLNNIYFQINFGTSLGDSTQKLFTLFPDSSRFIIRDKLNLLCVDSIPIDMSDLNFFYDANDSSYKVLIKLDTNAVALCSGARLLDRLRTSNHTISLKAIGFINDIEYIKPFYIRSAIIGQYVNTLIINGVETGILNSCDPYLQRFTFLHLQDSSRSRYASSQSNTYNGNYDQCKFAFELSTSFKGGLPNIDDFPDEFRPMYSYPESFYNPVDQNFNYVRGKIEINGSPYATIDTITPTNVLNTFFGSNPKAIEKADGNIQRLELVYGKACVNDSSAKGFLKDSLRIRKFAYTGNCSYCPVSSRFVKLLNTLQSTNDAIDVFINFPNNSNIFNTVQNPTAPIKLQLNTYKVGLYGGVFINSFFLVDTNSINANLITATLTDANSIPIPSTLIGNYFMFRLNSLNSLPKIFKLSLKVNACDKDTASYFPIKIPIIVSNACNGYDSLTPYNLLDCFAKYDTIILQPANTGISLKGDNTGIPSLVNGCTQQVIDLNVNSEGLTIPKATLQVRTPFFVSLVNDGCTIAGKKIATPFSFSFDFVNKQFVYSFNLLDSIPPDSFFSKSIYEKIPIHFVYRINVDSGFKVPDSTLFNISFKASGISSCGDTVSDDDINYMFRYQQPVAPVFAVPSYLCPNNTTQNPLQISVVNSNLFSSYIWTGTNGAVVSNDSSKYNIWHPGGSYAVKVFDLTKCETKKGWLIEDVSKSAVINATNNGTLTCYGDSVTLRVILNDSSLAASYLWSNGDTTNSIVVSPTSTTSYTVTVTYIGSCSFTLTKKVIVNYALCCNSGNTAFKQNMILNNGNISSGNYEMPSDIIIPGGTTFTIGPHVNLVVSAGRKITIRGGGTLIINQSTITGCNNMWKGIELVDPYSVLSLNSESIIDNANIGVEVKSDYAQLISDNVTFTNCVKGISFNEQNLAGYYHCFIQFKNSNQFKITSAGFLPDYLNQKAHGSIPYCGIEFNLGNYGLGYTTSNSSFYFSNLYRGIVSVNSSLNITNASFDSIRVDNFYTSSSNNYPFPRILSAGILSNKKQLPPIDFMTSSLLNVDGTTSKNMIFRNCSKGIHAISTTSRIAFTYMDKVNTGIMIGNCNSYLKSEILKNEIKARFRGIVGNNNHQASSIKIHDNTVTVFGNSISNKVGIGLYEVNPGGGNANYEVKYNAIKMTGDGIGLHINYVDGGTFAYNYIEQVANQSAVSTNVGISIDGSKNQKVSCNNIFNVDTTYLNTIGIRVNVSTIDTVNNAAISCNRIDNSGTGIYFGGPSNVNLATNEMYNNYRGLEIGSNGISGTQFHKGNKWVSYRDTGAYLVNQLGYQLSQFTVHTIEKQPINGYEFHPLKNDSDWFQVRLGTPEECLRLGGSSVCFVDTLRDPNTNATERLIAIGEIQSTIFNEETQSQTRLDLFNRLITDSSLYYSDQVYSTFYSNYEDEGIGQLSQLVHDYNQNFHYSSIEATLLAEVNQKFDSIELALTMLNTGNTDPVILDSLWRHRDQLKRFVYVVSQSIAQRWDTNTIRAILAEINNGIFADGYPERNHRSMNDIYLSSVDTNFYELEENNNLFNKIGAVAYQCPLQGGNSVYQARSYLAQYDNDPLYADQLNCFNVGIYRKGQQEMPSKIVIMPNPANEYVAIKTISPEEVISNYSITDYLGKLLVVKQNVISSNVVINTQNFPTGIYLLTVVLNNGKVLTEKLSLIH